MSGEYRGLADSVALLAKLAQWTHGAPRIDVHDLLANEQHGILMYTVSARHAERVLTYRYVDIYHFREGKITEVWGQVSSDAAEFDAFYSD